MPDKKYPEILEHLTALTSEVLEERGKLPKPEAEELASLIADRVGRDLAGQQVYFGRRVVFSERDYEIYHKFNGSNCNQLAKEYGLSARQIYYICARVRAEQIRGRSRI